MVKEFFIQGIFIICKLNCVEDECQFLTNCSLNNEERNTGIAKMQLVKPSSVYSYVIYPFSFWRPFLKKILLKRLFLHYITSKLTV